MLAGGFVDGGAAVYGRGRVLRYCHLFSLAFGMP